MKSGAGQRLKIIGAGLIFLLLLSGVVSGQNRQTEEIVVKLDIPRLLQKDVMARYDGKDIYIPLLELFSLLEIHVDADFAKAQFTGEYLYRDNRFELNLERYEAECFKRKLVIDSTWYIITEREVYIRPNLFEALFDLKLFFNFSDLSVYIPLQEDFPIYQKLKRHRMHKKLRDARVAATDAYPIPRQKHYLSAGVADWTLSTSPIGGSGHYLNLGLGMMVLGGDFQLHGTGNSRDGIRSDQINYRWHYSFNRNPYVSQIEAGDVHTEGYLGRSLKGVVLTNRPTVRRKFFQTMTVTDRLEPGWEIELYVNNRLADFAYTDENGEYNFTVDVEYGTTRVLLKKYGPGGEIETEEKFLTVPFNLLPKGEYEYTTALGQGDNIRGENNYFQAGGYYGLLNSLTLGLNTDLPLEKKGEKSLSAAELTYQPLGNLQVSGIYSPDYSMKYSLNYRHLTLLNVFGSYTKYYPNEFLNRFERDYNFSLNLSSPMKILGTYFSPRWRLSLDKYPGHDLVVMNYGFKVQVLGLGLNYIGHNQKSIYPTRTEKELSSRILLSTSLLRFLRPQASISYNHTEHKIMKIGFYVNRRIFKRGQISLSLERDPESRQNTIMATLNFFTDYAAFDSRFVQSGENHALTQTQRGSIRFDPNLKSFRFRRHSGLGSGSAVIWPFQDDNYNGIRDEGEELLPELRAKISGGARIDRARDRLFYYDNLRPYEEYIVEIDPYSLDNPMLQPAHENFRVAVNPNVVTTINVPIVTAGEVAGRVDRLIADGTVGVGGMRVIIINEATGKEIELVTFNNGDFFHLGLVPGMYRAYLDPEQLKNYGYASDPPYIKFQMKTIAGGDYFGTAAFIIRPSTGTH